MSEDVVEIEAVDVDEWERDRHTPRAADQKVAELVKQTVEADKPAAQPPAVHARTTTRPKSQVMPAVPTPKGTQSNAAITAADKPVRADATPARTSTKQIVRTVTRPMGVPAIPAPDATNPPGETKSGADGVPSKKATRIDMPVVKAPAPKVATNTVAKPAKPATVERVSPSPAKATRSDLTPVPKPVEAAKPARADATPAPRVSVNTVAKQPKSTTVERMSEPATRTIVAEPADTWAAPTNAGPPPSPDVWTQPTNPNTPVPVAKRTSPAVIARSATRKSAPVATPVIAKPHGEEAAFDESWDEIPRVPISAVVAVAIEDIPSSPVLAVEDDDLEIPIEMVKPLVARVESSSSVPVLRVESSASLAPVIAPITPVASIDEFEWPPTDEVEVEPVVAPAKLARVTIPSMAAVVPGEAPMPPVVAAQPPAGKAPDAEAWSSDESTSPVTEPLPEANEFPVREPSVIIDLNARAEASPVPARASSSQAVMTSERSASVSGAFVMPTPPPRATATAEHRPLRETRDIPNPSAKPAAAKPAPAKPAPAKPAPAKPAPVETQRPVRPSSQLAAWSEPNNDWAESADSWSEPSTGNLEAWPEPIEQRWPSQRTSVASPNAARQAMSIAAQPEPVVAAEPPMPATEPTKTALPLPAPTLDSGPVMQPPVPVAQPMPVAQPVMPVAQPMPMPVAQPMPIAQPMPVAPQPYPVYPFARDSQPAMSAHDVATNPAVAALPRESQPVMPSQRDSMPVMPQQPHDAWDVPVVVTGMAPRTKRLLAIGLGGMAALVAVLALALSGGSTGTGSGASDTKAPVVATSESTKTATPSVASRSAKSEPGVAPTESSEPSEPTEAVPATTPASPTAKQPVKRPLARRASATKPVVVDYDKAPSQNPQTDGLAKARGSYTQGNQHLFAGETAAAIVSYQQALVDYPTYAAGYRGLGLAYAQQGDRADAIKAFKQYLALAPTAKDADLIAKRMNHLAGH